MADYYPLIERAIAGLDANAPGESRRALYERARTALIAQLRSVQPPLTENEITRERLSLEEAIRKIESETSARVRTAQLRSEIAARSIEENTRVRLSLREELLKFQASDADSSSWMQKPPSRPSSQVRRDLEQAIREIDADLERRSKERMREAKQAANTDFEAITTVTLPPVSVIPEQNETVAIAFRPSRRGPLELIPDFPKDPLDPEQSQLYSRIRRRLERLKDDIPHQERQLINDALDEFLDQPPTWQQIESRKVLWLCGNALRNKLAQHDAVKHSDEPHYSKLPPTVAEALRGPVEGWNIFVLGDQLLVNLDAKRIGPEEQQSLLKDIIAAKPILVDAASDRNITTEEAGKVIDASLQTTELRADNIHTRQAQDLAAGTSKNLIIQLLRRAYLTCQAIANPQNDDDRALLSEFKKGVAKKVGEATVSVTLAGAAYVAPYGLSFLEFVVQHAAEMKTYIVVALQNNQLSQVIDAIQHIRTGLLTADDK